MDNKIFREQIIEIVSEVYFSRKLTYETSHYTVENECEVLNITDIESKQCKVSILDDVALVSIEENQYDFELWRYKDFVDLKRELLNLLYMKL